MHAQVPHLEDALQPRPHNDKESQTDLDDDAQVQHVVRNSEVKNGLLHGSTGNRCTHLAQNECPVVSGHASIFCLNFCRAIARRGFVFLEEHIHVRNTDNKDGPTSQTLHDANVAVGVEQNPTAHHPVFLRMSRWPFHEITLRRLPCVCNGSPDVGADIDEQHLHRCNGCGHAQELGKRGHHLRKLRTQRVHDGLLQVVRAKSALFYPCHHALQVIVQENDVCSLLCHLRAADSHGNAHLGHLEGRCVVYTVPRHGCDVPSKVLKCPHNDALVHRRHTRKDARVPDAHAPEVQQLWGEHCG
mmetsp:Transcript_60315/g.140490  ORF Transcript_60315/g.140490 Transcript_60315/m.140490 type:complete len:301 (-) Transcript_60315:1268-2170(-)